MRTLTVYKPFDFENAFSAFDRDLRGCSPIMEMGRMMDNIFGSAGQPSGSASFVRIPAVDVEETDKSYVLEAELPGFAMEDVSVNLDGGTVTIASSKDETAGKEDDKAKNLVLRERRSRSFSRSFKLPENADPAAISATFKNGLLVLTIGKRTEAQKKTIQIEG
ncbi:MAG: Hsp20/alpha crystallin family protein [Spirochaetaceae bacterium]|jgi:HSP20 family molecular chaperone IbpA|nr:Hsp20/alpha crystallin family protein [Spirochaetaceae bacterium]